MGSGAQPEHEKAMKAINSIFLAFLITASAEFGAGAQSVTNTINPALLYYQAFLVAPDLSEADSDYLWTNEWHGQQLPEQFGILMAGYDNEFKLVRDAALSTAPCDWGLDARFGPDALLPYLGRTKPVVLTANFRALWDLQQGRQDDARQEVVAGLVLGRNVARDGTLISVLVQQAMELITCHHLAELFGRFSKDELQQLLDGIESAPARRTAAECAATQGALIRNWALSEIQRLQQANPGNDAQVLAGIHAAFAKFLDAQPNQTRMSGSTQELTANSAVHGETAPADWWGRLSQAAGGTSDGVARLVQGLESFDQKLASVLSLPAGEFADQMVRFKADLQQNPNPLPSLLLPPWEHVRGRELRAMANLDMVRAAIEFELHGQAAFQSVMDPWSQGPFAFERFAYQGVDRGFKLTSAYPGNPWPESVIFVEKPGAPFHVDGRNLGEPRPHTYPK